MQKKSKYSLAFLTALVPLVVMLFVSCSSAPKKVELSPETMQQWNAAIEKNIAEPERAAKLKQLGQQLIDVSSSIQQDIQVFNKKAMALHENHEATHEELQQLIGKFSEKRGPKFAEYRDTIFAMRSEVSAEEWKALTD